MACTALASGASCCAGVSAAHGEQRQLCRPAAGAGGAQQQPGITHYAMSMPTLEEVFLACTAEPSLSEEGAHRCSHKERSHQASRGAAGRALPDCSDGHVVIQMSALGAATKQSASPPRAQAAGRSSPSPGGSSASPQRMEGSCGAASVSEPDRPGKQSMLGDGVAGSSHRPSPRAR